MTRRCCSTTPPGRGSPTPRCSDGPGRTRSPTHSRRAGSRRACRFYLKPATPRGPLESTTNCSPNCSRSPTFASISDVEQRAIDAQRQLARVGHHRPPPVDLFVASIADRHGRRQSCTTTATMTCSHEKTDLDVGGVWLAPGGQPLSNQERLRTRASGRCQNKPWWTASTAAWTRLSTWSLSRCSDVAAHGAGADRQRVGDLEVGLAFESRPRT